jgi:hypothetical protein
MSPMKAYSKRSSSATKSEGTPDFGVAAICVGVTKAEVQVCRWNVESELIPY